MSVSDPLLKRLKGHIYELRMTSDHVTDKHKCLLLFCDTLELILRKGLKQTTSIFGTTRRDYWTWIEAVANFNKENSSLNPKFSMIVDDIKKCRKTCTAQGRGRLFIRQALQKKVLSVPLEHILRVSGQAQMWYEPHISILGDEILSEILMSLLHEVTEIPFQLNTKISTFLDETWMIPEYQEYEIVPCKDLGMQVQFIEGRPITISILAGSVAEEDDKIKEGDHIDEVLGHVTRNMKVGQVSSMLKQNRGSPVNIAITKCLMEDGTIFPPIAALLRIAGKDVKNLQRMLQQDEERKRKLEENAKLPPHARLTEEGELPVQGDQDDKARYRVKYAGKLNIGPSGGVHNVETVVAKVLERHEDVQDLPENGNMEDVYIELGETGVIVTKDSKKNEVKFNHSYSEISSCGRRVDHVLYFAYIAGETTCTLAKNFVAYVFKGATDIESKTILCSIAQGFNRTHWMV